MTALERIFSQKGVTDEMSLSQRKDEWEEAAHHTPHGQPIELGRHE